MLTILKFIARGSEPLIYPYIRPFGPRFQPEEEIPYLKYRKALEECGKDLSEPLLGQHTAAAAQERTNSGPLPTLQTRTIAIEVLEITRPPRYPAENPALESLYRI